MSKIKTVDPSTGAVIREYAALSESEIDSSLDRAREGFHVWRRQAIPERGRFLSELGKVLKSEREMLSQLVTQEMGKPVTESRSEVDKCAMACAHYAERAGEWLSDEVLVESAPRAMVSFQPLGTILGIMPWNFPLWQAIRFAAPTLMAGNVVLIKHAPNTWGSSKALAECFWKAGFPKGVYQDLPMDVEWAPKVIADARINGVSLTGSTRAGRSVAEAAGRALKKVVLELGGSDAYVVLDDADVAMAADKAVQARMLNGGQSCIAGKRFIVTDRNAREFRDRVLEKMSAIRPEDPRLESARLGPMARQDLRDGLHKQVLKAIEHGAHCELGGKLPEAPGFFYPPTVLTQIDASSPVHQEEFFGPVAAIAVARDETEAIRLANSSPFGLGAAVFSRDEERALKLARTEIQSGMCFINGVVRSDPRWPFGGIKDSGLGRELAEYGTHEFVNIKTLVVDPRS